MMMGVIIASALALGVLLGGAAICWFQRHDGLAPEAAVEGDGIVSREDPLDADARSIEDIARQVGA